jgi:hypothetical protein
MVQRGIQAFPPSAQNLEQKAMSGDSSFSAFGAKS